MTIWQKKTIFFTTTPKTLFFWAFFEIFLFQLFRIFLFTFSNIKTTKIKSAHFFRKPFFWHPDKLPKKYFRTPYTLFVILNIPIKHYKSGENKQTSILDQVLTQPWTKFWLKKPQILDQVLTLQRKALKIVVSGEIVQNQKMTPFFSKKCFFFLTWVKNWVLLTVFLKSCVLPKTLFYSAFSKTQQLQ